MKKIVLLVSVTLGLCPLTTFSQNIIQLYESQFYDPAVPDSNQVANSGIVDINSDLIVRIDKTEVMRRMNELFPTPKNTWSNVDELTALLRNQNETLQLFNQSLENPSDAPNYDLYGQLALLQVQFLDEVMDSPFLLELYNEAEAAYRQKLQLGTIADPLEMPEELFILQYFAEKSKEYAEAAAAEAENVFEASDIRFLMAGFLISDNDQRPIHLNKRVDTYEPEAYVVPRWVYSLSENDLDELEAAAAMAETLEQTTEVTQQKVIELVRATFASDDCLNAIKVEFDNLRQRLPNIAEDAQRQLNDLLLDPYRHLEQTLIHIRSITAESQTPSSVELLAGFSQSIELCVRELEAYSVSYTENFESRLQDIADSVRTQLQIDLLLTLNEDCQNAIQSDLEKLDRLGNFLNGIVTPTQQGAQATLEITESVRRLRPNEIPEQFTLRLRRTGKRANGDQIEILALAEVPNADEPLPLETRYFTMQQIDIYSEAKVMVTLANPISGNSKIDLESEFQFAPSYSVLFRWGSRKSRAWNNFWNVGIGLNFAAPDFDTDGIPEFGAGLVVTSFKDFVSTGISYNFGVGAPYYFVGFRVPFTSTVLPVLNSVNVESGGY